MISLVEVAERARTGPRINEKDWNLGLFKKMVELEKTYDLEYFGSEQLFKVDKSYADNAFRAAVDFLTNVGVYCISSNRTIKFSEEEIKEACRDAPAEIIVGRGKDARVIRRREVEGVQPVNFIAAGSCPWSEELFPLPLMVSALARIPRVDIVEAFNFVSVDGVKSDGIPLAGHTARRAIERMREGVRKAGREGLAITYYPIRTDASTLIAPIDPDYGLRRSDGILLSILPDIKVEENLLMASMTYDDYGCYRVNAGAYASVGGFCGGTPGAVIETLAKTITAWMIYHDSIQYNGCLEDLTCVPALTQETTENPPAVVSAYAISEALRRNANLIMFGGNQRFWNVLKTPSDPLYSEENLLAEALSIIIDTVIGKNLVGSYDSSNPAMIEWEIEVSDATVKGKIKLSDVEEIIRSVVRQKLHGKLLKANVDRRLSVYTDPNVFIGPIKECYDFVHQRASNVFVENRNKTRSYLENLGLRFS